MRRAWAVVVGGILGAVGVVVWAVSLAIYQQRMEPSGYSVEPNTGQPYANVALTNTYWPREVRQLAILLVLGAVLAIGRASKRAFVVAGALGVVWFSADIWLDRVDIDGRSASLWLMVSYGIVFAAAAVVARRGPVWERGRLVAAVMAAVLAPVPIEITNPWHEPLTQADQIAINSAITAMDIALAVGLLVVAVTIAAPAITSARSLTLVPVGTFVTAAATVYHIVHRADAGPVLRLTAPVTIALGVMTVFAAHEVAVRDLALMGSLSVIATPAILAALFLIGIPAGQLLTSLANSPPVNTEDWANFDLAYVPPMLLVGLALGALGSSLIKRSRPPEQPSIVDGSGPGMPSTAVPVGTLP